ncbi:MAG: MraZ N-terminal domain-containing protein, partial [candidate division WOR-3 bacterium]
MNGDKINLNGDKINLNGEERGYNFTGVYFHTIDEKGRIAIPLPFRLALPQESKDRLFISPGLSKTIFCYPTPEWKRFRNCVLSFFSHFEENE